MLTAADPIFAPAPLDRHPLNEGRQAWWLAVPGTDGGRQFLDLGGRHPGTLTGFDATTGWKAPYRAGGLAPGLKLKDVASYLDGASLSPRLVGLRRASLACWVHRTPGTVFGVGQGRGSSQFSRFGILWYSDNRIYCYAEDGVSSYPSALSTAAGWHRVLMAWSGQDSMTLYLDGQPAAGFGPNGSSSLATAAQIQDPGAFPFQAGRIDNGGYVGGTGSFDDISAWGRALSPAEAAEDYALSRAGYPGVLRRVGPTPALLLPAATVATAPGKKGGGKGTQAAYRLGTRTPSTPTPGL